MLLYCILFICIYINDGYSQYFHLRDYEVLISFSKEDVELTIKEEEDKDNLEMYN